MMSDLTESGVVLRLDLFEEQREALSRLLWGKSLTSEQERLIDGLSDAVGQPE